MLDSIRVRFGAGLARASGMVFFLALAQAGVAAAEDSSDPLALGRFDPSSFSVVWLQRSAEVARAGSALEEGDFDRATELAESALATDLRAIDRLAALNTLCIAHVSRGAPGRALQYCDRLVRERRSDWRCLNNRAAARLAAGDPHGAIADYESAVDLLRESGDRRRIRPPGSAVLRPALETLLGNLELARQRLSADLQIARSGGGAIRK